MIVIAIIGILAVVFLPTILGAPIKARDTARKADLTNIVNAITAASVDGKSLPPAGVYCLDSSNFSTYIPYLKGGLIPKDPDANSFIDGFSSNDCRDENSGKYLLKIYSTAPIDMQLMAGGFKYAVFANMGDNSVSNIRCDYIGGSFNLNVDTFITPPIDAEQDYCYGVKSN